MPASLNPFQTILELILKYKNTDSIHWALSGFIALNFKSIRITSVDCSCNCVCKLTGKSTISNLWLSKSFRIDEVVWALKLSRINKTGWLLDNWSSFLFSLKYGSMIFSKYYFMVISFDQWLSECVTCHVDGKSNWGKHRLVFLSLLNWGGKISPVIEPQNTAVICLLSSLARYFYPFKPLLLPWSKVSLGHSSKPSDQSSR